MRLEDPKKETDCGSQEGHEANGRREYQRDGCGVRKDDRFAVSGRYQASCRNFDRTDKGTAGKMGGLDLTVKKTVESTEHACHRNVKCQGTLEKTGRGRVADAN